MVRSFQLIELFQLRFKVSEVQVFFFKLEVVWSGFLVILGFFIGSWFYFLDDFSSVVKLDRDVVSVYLFKQVLYPLFGGQFVFVFLSFLDFLGHARAGCE